MDIQTRISRALVAIANADTGLQALCGRVTGLMVLWQDIGDADLPVLAYQFIVLPEIGGVGDNRKPIVQVAAIAEGNGAAELVNGMMERVELGFTQPLIAAQSVDGCILTRSRRPLSLPPEETRALVGETIEQTWWVTV